MIESIDQLEKQTVRRKENLVNACNKLDKEDALRCLLIDLASENKEIRIAATRIATEELLKIVETDRVKISCEILSQSETVE